MDLFPSRTNPPAAAAADDSPAEMDAEIRLVARFYSLTLWRIIASTALAAFEVMCAAACLRMVSGFYILCLINLLPALLEPFCAPHVQKSVPVLPFLRKRYHYSSLRFTTMEITFLITGALLLLWQFHNQTPAYPAAWLYHFPALLLGLGVLWHALSPALLFFHIRKKMGGI